MLLGIALAGPPKAKPCPDCKGRGVRILMRRGRPTTKFNCESCKGAGVIVPERGVVTDPYQRAVLERLAREKEAAERERQIAIARAESARRAAEKHRQEADDRARRDREELERIEREVNELEAARVRMEAARRAQEEEDDRLLAQWLAEEQAALAAKAAAAHVETPSVVEIVAKAARNARGHKKGYTIDDYLNAGAGKEPDRVVAERLGVAGPTVTLMRQRHGIPAFRAGVFNSEASRVQSARKERTRARKDMTLAEQFADLAQQLARMMASDPKRAHRILDKIDSAKKKTKRPLRGIPLGLVF